MSKEGSLATPVVETGATPKPPDKSWEYFLRIVVIVAGMALGAIAGFFIALFSGWIAFC